MSGCHRRYVLCLARDLSADQIAAWTEILNESELLPSPYLRPEFTQAVAVVRNDIEVAVAERDDEPVAFLPFRRMPWGGGRPAADGWRTFRRSSPERILNSIPSRYCKRATCDLAIRSVAAASQERRAVCVAVVESPYADLSDGFEGYCRRLRVGRNRLTELQRQQRKMARDLGEVRFEHHVSDRKILQTLFEWKAAQYTRTRERNIFASSWVRELLDQLLDYQSDVLSSLLSVLYVGDRIAAVAYTLRSGPNLHGWFTSFDRELYTYSPGMQLLLELFRSAESLGIRRVDLGKGPENYKRRFMTDATQVHEGTIDASALVSNIRQSWWHTKDWVRASRLANTARASAKLVRGMQGWLEMG